MSLLNYDKFTLSVDTNGPGRRIVLWVQGCTLACKGCFNKELWAHRKNYVTSTDELSSYLLKLLDEHDCEGLTLTGGEPLQQAQAIGDLLEKIQDANYTSVVFTGYTLQELENAGDSQINHVLTLIDILIAGRYNHENKDIVRTWAENPDKTVHFLSEKYKNKQFHNQIPNIEATIVDDEIDLTGFLDINSLETFIKNAKENKIEFSEKDYQKLLLKLPNVSVKKAKNEDTSGY